MTVPYHPVERGVKAPAEACRARLGPLACRAKLTVRKHVGRKKDVEETERYVYLL